MTTDKEHFTRVLNKLTEGGLLPRGKTSDLVAEYDSAVAQIADEDRAAAEVEDAVRAESPASMGSFGVLSGTLTVSSDPVTDAIDTDPERDTIELTDEDVTLVDDEPTSVGSKKRKKH